jgi:hypothetical protein
MHVPSNSLLNLKKKTIWEIDYQELNKFVWKVYPKLKKCYDYVRLQECGNDCIQNHDVGFFSELTEEEYQKIISGNVEYVGTTSVFSCLLRDGYIPNYLEEIYVNVCW